MPYVYAFFNSVLNKTEKVTSKIGIGVNPSMDGLVPVQKLAELGSVKFLLQCYLNSILNLNFKNKVSIHKQSLVLAY